MYKIFKDFLLSTGEVMKLVRRGGKTDLQGEIFLAIQAEYCFYDLTFKRENFRKLSL